MTSFRKNFGLIEMLDYKKRNKLPKNYYKTQLKESKNETH